MNKKYILFDLDGTLTDTAEGITKSVQYALEAQGIKEENLDNLTCYIGPPLDESFQKFHGIPQAVSFSLPQKSSAVWSWARMSLSIPVRLCVQAMEKSPLATKQIYRKTSPSM